MESEVRVEPPHSGAHLEHMLGGFVRRGHEKNCTVERLCASQRGWLAVHAPGRYLKDRPGTSLPAFVYFFWRSRRPQACS